MTQQLIILQTLIRQDSQGRYCLNDCHKASGMGEEKRPSKWMTTQSSQELVDELEVSPFSGLPVNIVKTGLNEHRGIYAVKELVYAYAMWISPSFNLQVIRAYDDLVTKPQFQIPQTLSDALRFAADQAETISVLQPKADGFDLIADSDGAVLPTDAAKDLQMNRIVLVDELLKRKWVYRRGNKGVLRAYQDKIDAGYLVHKLSEYKDKKGFPAYSEQLMITHKGLTKLAVLLNVRKVA